MRKFDFPAIILAVSLLGSSVAAQPAADVRVYVPDLKFAVALPAVCRHVTGPGTVEAVCDPDLDPARRTTAPAATGILLEVDAEIAPADAPAYSEAAFRQELPETVCGESDPARVTLTNVSATTTGPATTWSATVTCAAVAFLQMSERQAEARTIIVGAYRYRLTTRWPSASAAQARPLAERFLASFNSTAP